MEDLPIQARTFNRTGFSKIFFWEICYSFKFMFSKKTKIDEIFTVNLMLYSKGQINGEDFVNFHGFLKEYEL